MIKSVYQYILQPSLEKPLCAEDGYYFQVTQLFTAQGARLHSGGLSGDSSIRPPPPKPQGSSKGEEIEWPW